MKLKSVKKPYKSTPRIQVVNTSNLKEIRELFPPLWTRDVAVLQTLPIFLGKYPKKKNSLKILTVIVIAKLHKFLRINPTDPNHNGLGVIFYTMADTQFT
jgi:hypothetical protein